MKNTGNLPGAEVVEVYVHDGHSKIDRPVHELKAFKRVELRSGETKTFWGDLHGQTRATVGTGTIEEYFAFGRDVVWSHPAYADKCVFARNDKEIVCASLAAE